ncbi:MAG: ABC transporter ATP-binding protein [Desulfobacterales bacterium]|nr:ABC transporter ATP-binding protein [Desulfobacterales bacterium]
MTLTKNNPIVLLENCSKNYDKPVLKKFDLKIYEKEKIAIVGRSGSGKSTLLNILAGYTEISQGRYVYCDSEIHSVAKNNQEAIKLRKECAFINQNNVLFRNFNVEENLHIVLSLKNKLKNKQYIENIDKVLNDVNLDPSIYKKKMPDELSGGERQRVNIARAVITEPKILFCDEPTGSLDTHSSNIVIEIILNCCEKHHSTIMLVTHSPSAACLCDRIIGISEGQKIFDVSNKNKNNIKEADIIQFICKPNSCNVTKMSKMKEIQN